MAAKASVDAHAWRERLEEFTTWIGERVHRVEPRRRLVKLVTGMIAGLPRVNCWSIAEHTGEPDPRGLRRLLSTAAVDTDGLSCDLRDYIVTHVGEPDGVLIVDETGDVKKGAATVGVAPQHTGTAGRVVNAQVAVYLAYASSRGYAFLDRALHLPRKWTQDTDRCATAGIPQQVAFATKPALAAQLIQTALAGGVPGVCRAPGSPVMRCTALIRSCVRRSPQRGSGSSWRWLAPTGWSPLLTSHFRIAWSLWRRRHQATARASAARAARAAERTPP